MFAKNKRIITLIYILEIIIVIGGIVFSVCRKTDSYTFTAADLLSDGGLVQNDSLVMTQGDSNSLCSICTPAIPLHCGTYEVDFLYNPYESEDEHSYDFLNQGYPYYGLRYDEGVSLDERYHSQTAHLRVSVYTEGFQTRVIYNGQGTFSIQGITIRETKAFDHVLCTLGVIILFMTHAMICIVKKRGEGVTAKSVLIQRPLFLVLLIGLIACECVKKSL